MQQQISVITLGVADLARSRRFYADGFGWRPVFENEEIAWNPAWKIDERGMVTFGV